MSAGTNNPLNVRRTAIKWQGELPGAGAFADFDSVGNGIRAAMLCFIASWRDHGCDTVAQIIARYAPPADNNPTAAYARFVANQMGIAPDDPVDLRDRATLIKLAAASAWFETHATLDAAILESAATSALAHLGPSRPARSTTHMSSTPAVTLASSTAAGTSSAGLVIMIQEIAKHYGLDMSNAFALSLAALVSPVLHFAGTAAASWIRSKTGLSLPQAGAAAAIACCMMIGGLTACQITGNLDADTQANLKKLQDFAPQVAAFDAKAQVDIAAFNAGAITHAAAVGKSACGLAAMDHGLFQLALPIAVATGAASPAIGTTEAAVMGGVELGCAVLDKADPSTPAATIAEATASVLAAVPQIKDAVKAIAPDAAAAATAPATPAS
jgi:hypothetical protein